MNSKFFKMSRHKSVFFYVQLFVVFFVLTGCFGSGSSNGENNGNSGNNSNLTIDIQLETLNYIVGDSVKVPFKVHDGQDTHYTSNYQFIFENNKANASGKWVKRSNENLYDYVITVEKEGTFDFIANYKNGSKTYKSEKITFTFEYQKIETIEDLLLLNNSNKIYKLTTNIDLSDISSWTPIEEFSGKLFGNNYQIQNLKIRNLNKDNIGLFGTLKGEVFDLILADVDIELTSSYSNVGALAGTATNQVQNVRAIGTINTPYYKNVGGLIGLSKSALLIENSSALEVTGLDSVGGIVGKVESQFTQFNNNLNIGVVRGNSMVGGVAGTVFIDNDRTIDGNSNEGQIYGSGDNVGGIIGLLTHSSSGYTSGKNSYFNNNENQGDVTSTGDNIGGLIGRQTSNNSSTSNYDYQLHVSISNAKNSGIISGSSNTGGIIGRGDYIKEIKLSENTASITGKEYVGGYVGRAVNAKLIGLVNKQTIQGTSYVGGIAGLTNIIIDSDNNGEIISTGVIFENSTAVAYVGGVAGYVYGIQNSKNTSDIKVTTNGFYVGGLIGAVNLEKLPTLDGNVNSGDVESTGKHVGGLYGSLVGTVSGYSSNRLAVVSNNINEGKVFGSSDYVGGIIGSQDTKNSSTNDLSYQIFLSILSNENKGEVQGKSYTGGLIGYGRYVNNVNLNSNTADITGENYVGGYIGQAAQGVVNQAVNKQTIRGKSYVGGIAGYIKTVNNATNEGEVISSGVTIEDNDPVACVGGIAGYAYSINDSRNESNISIETGGYYVGGIAGFMNTNQLLNITNNINNGDITSNSNFVGGIVGAISARVGSYISNRNIDITNNINYGDIYTTGNYVGGLFAYQYSYNSSTSSVDYQVFIRISNSSNYGNVTGNRYVAGILGYGTYIFGSTSIWDTNINEGIVLGNSDFGNKFGYIKTTK